MTQKPTDMGFSPPTNDLEEISTDPILLNSFKSIVHSNISSESDDCRFNRLSIIRLLCESGKNPRNPMISWDGLAGINGHCMTKKTADDSVQPLTI
jgi:hypothetical protein